ncbi:DNA-binding response regulator, NarL/FixJ family, contains REC and HTH domains [Lachnospiraceae bacterium NE2001]|nr:DNA-binding response regulator, NarL/FixJ family, contains REC and HTH domains [Lachnospiraceae bacterium NE2001]
MKVVIVDDDRLVAMSLKTIVESDPEIEVLATGCSGQEAIELYEEHQPDVLLTDIRMEGMTGLEAGEKILTEHPEAKLLYLTTFNDDEYIVKALSIGAKGYIIKQDFDSIVPSLKAVYSGQSVFGNEITEKLPNILSSRTDTNSGTDGQGNDTNDQDNGATGQATHFDHTAYDLTEQEAEIVKCVADGLSNKEIADTLFLSEGTVRNYISNILSKLELRDRTNLAIFYYKHS